MLARAVRDLAARKGGGKIDICALGTGPVIRKVAAWPETIVPAILAFWFIFGA